MTTREQRLRSLEHSCPVSKGFVGPVLGLKTQVIHGTKFQDQDQDLIDASMWIYGYKTVNIAQKGIHEIFGFYERPKYT